MGVVNVTDDSFSGDGVLDPDKAVALALAHERAGANIIDIGGQSTRPGYKPIDEELELNRILPVIRRLKERSTVVISVDTYRPAVARAALSAGADILNSIWGLDDRLLDVVGEFHCPLVIMHNKAKAQYDGDIVQEICSYFAEQTKKAIAVGLGKEEIILDPGIGFGKNAEHNIEILRRLAEIAALGYPLLIGTSRKSTIGKLIEREPHERLWGTAASCALAIAGGADILRVHDMKEMMDVVKVSDAIVRNWRPDHWQ